MELRPIATAERPFVQGYWPGGFTVGGARRAGSLILLPDRILPWRPADPSALVAADLALPEDDAEPLPRLLLLGLGAHAVGSAASLRAALAARGVAVEPMTTPAACRTWNLVLAEGRRAAAALLALP